MIFAETTRSPQTGKHAHSVYNLDGTGQTDDVMENGTGSTNDHTYTSSASNDQGTSSYGETTRGTTDASGGVTHYTTSSTHIHPSGTAPDVNDHGEIKPTPGAGATTIISLTTGIRVTSPNSQCSVSTTFAETYHYPASTLSGTTPTTKDTFTTHSQTTSTVDMSARTRQTAATMEITCSSRFERIATVALLLDIERGWVFAGGGVGVHPLQDICSEAAESILLTASTSTLARVRPVVNASVQVAFSDYGITTGGQTASWTTTATTNAAPYTNVSTDSLPNSTETGTGYGITTIQATEILATASAALTAPANAHASESYRWTGVLSTTSARWIPAFDDAGLVTGLTTRSAQWTKTTDGTGFRAAEVALSDSSYTEGYSETVTVALSLGGFIDLGRGNPVDLWVQPYVPQAPMGVRIYSNSTQTRIFAQINVSGLGFTVPAPEAFSMFERSGGVFSPLAKTYTATDVSAGTTRSYTVAIGTSSSNDTALCLSATRATVSSAKSTASASFSDAHELTRRWMTMGENFPEPGFSYQGGEFPSPVDYRWILGGQQVDSRLEQCILHEMVSDATTVESTTTNGGTIGTNTNLTTAAPTSALLAFRLLGGYSTTNAGGQQWTVSPKWPDVNLSA